MFLAAAQNVSIPSSGETLSGASRGFSLRQNVCVLLSNLVVIRWLTSSQEPLLAPDNVSPDEGIGTRRSRNEDPGIGGLGTRIPQTRTSRNKKRSISQTPSKQNALQAKRPILAFYYDNLQILLPVIWPVTFPLHQHAQNSYPSLVTYTKRADSSLSSTLYTVPRS